MASILQIRRNAKLFHSLENEEQLAALMRIPLYQIQLQASKPLYDVFETKKKNGKKRLIEEPNDLLKAIQSKLNSYLQAVYYKIRPANVYGFCINTNNEEDLNIISNAKKHLGKAYLLNIDLKDFFHHITDEMAFKACQTLFPKMEDSLIELIVKLCTFNGRLPMGAVTSPIFSNICSLNMDHELLEYCKYADIKFTRYADDMSFSSNSKILDIDIESISKIINQNKHIINPDKVTYYDPTANKMVTGLVVGKDEVSLPETYLPQLEKELIRFENVYIVEQRFQTGMSEKKLKLFEQELRGKINFANMVMPKSEQIDNLYDKFKEIIEAPERFESFDWLDLPYEFL